MDKIKPNILQEKIKKVLQMESEAVLSLIENIDYQVLLKTAETIIACKGKIITTGCGTSGVAAKKIAHSFSCTRRPAFFLSPAEALHGGLGVVDSSDIVILISKGGKTDELIGMLKNLKAISPTIIVVSENNSSPMVGVADICIKIPILQEPDSFDMLATSSTLATIAYFDALIIFIKEWSGFTKEDFLLVHPGGAVGERLIHDISK